MDNSGTPTHHLNNGSATNEAPQGPPFGYIEADTDTGPSLFAIGEIQAVSPGRASGAPVFGVCGIVVKGVGVIPVKHSTREIARRIEDAKRRQWYVLMGMEAQRHTPTTPTEEATARAHECRRKAAIEHTLRRDQDARNAADANETAASTTAAVPAASTTPPPACRHCTQPMAPAHGGGFECIPCGLTAPDPPTPAPAD